ncbi:hypothetical protein EUTSA_v10000112mg [Eutrema salsugineum]|uniref:NB-ARC domain-containing protein n=1 Tax=Eutrema salsugineum TaxID=72664 RepID=V4L885_EUTSA|nr:hypothetical protein EUTSA_v10000112mg [Eutrema salsugineum]
MGISFSIPCDPCTNKIFDWLDEKVACIQNLKKNLKALETTMKELKAKWDDLSRRVTREEDKGMLTRTETIEREVNDLLIATARDDELQRLCLCGFCSKSLRSSYHGKKGFLMLRDVEKLKCSGVFGVVAEQAQLPEVLERQLQPTIVGQETMLHKAWKYLRKDGVGIMGLYGMGGVGKTTLLEQINNKFTEERCGFDFVIWVVVVSKELNVEKIQDEIARKLGFDGWEWKEKEKTQKVDVLFNFLKNKKIVLFLDDIWEKVELKKIGIPFPTTQNRCKVAFTTRSQDMCAHMGVEDPMEVQCVADSDAFDLFRKKTKLMEYWIGEGIIDGSECVEKAENEGYVIINSLVHASLLMEDQREKNIVRVHDVERLHDVVRLGLREMPKVKNWKVVRKMSLMNNNIHHLAGSAECLELTTLVMQGTSLAKISSEFFNSMPKLVVLDLSVVIRICKYLRELTFLMFAPNLKILYVIGSHELEDIINKEKACEGKELEIVPFQKLISLTFGTHGGNGLIIRYSVKEWFDGVEWKDEATKTHFLLSCPQPSRRS